MPPASIFPDQSPTPRFFRNFAPKMVGWIAAGLVGLALISPEGQAQDKPDDRNPLDATAAGPDVRLVVDVRPLGLLKLPMYQKFADQIPEDSKEVKAFKSGAIEQVLAFVSEPKGRKQPSRPGTPPRPVFVLRSAKAIEWKDFISAKVDQVAGQGFTFLRTSGGQSSACYRVLDDRTLLVGFGEADMASPPIGTGSTKGPHSWDDAWKGLAPGPIRVALDASMLARLVPPGREGAGWQVISPLLNQVKGYAMTLDVTNALTLDATATSPDPAAAARVAETLRAVLTLSRNIIPEIRRQAPKGPPQAVEMTNNLVGALDSMLATAKVEQAVTSTRLRMKVDGVTAVTATALLLPAVQAAREAARRAECSNNLKRIGLAMQTYVSVNNRYPNSSVIGRYGIDGNVPHSWRVAILPYLDETALYNEYNFFEPWDGPNNIKLVDRMPKVFRDPSDTDSKPSSPSYFALTGPDTMFPSRKEGMKIAEVTDGTSNTVLVVEAKRDIPWTKPEDIPFDRDQPIPRLGGMHPGGFNALFADGSVRFLKSAINQVILRALVTPAGGEFIAADAY